MKKKKFSRFFKIIKIYFLLDFIRKIRFFFYRFHHPYIKFLYQSGSATPHAHNPKQSSEFTRHLVAIKSSLDYPLTSQWKEITAEYHYKIIQYLKEENYAKVERMVANPGSNDVMYGFDNLAKSLQSNLRLETRYQSALTADHFFALAEYLGVANCQGPEGVVSLKKKVVDIKPVIKKIVEKVFKRNIMFPNIYLGETGIITPFGVASLRVPIAIYQAHQVIRYGKNICEIGPGLGRTAYFASLLGAKKYTLVDIPISSICQGYFLLNSLPDKRFSVSGDNKIDEGIQLRLPFEFLNSLETYDVILNCDSLTEIGIDTARQYMRKITTSTKYFVSINHEGNEFSIRDLAMEFKELKLILRCRSWIRPGFIEEIYKIQKSES